MEKIFHSSVSTKLGMLTVSADEDALIGVNLNSAVPENAESSRITETAVSQITEYLNGHRKSFSVPFKLEGSNFFKRVLLCVLEVPYGTTVSYGYIAKQIKRGSQRAVGHALAVNPLPLIIPCHRIVRADMDAGGFGWGRAAKEFLIRIESEHL